MNYHTSPTLTRSQQRIKQLIALKRPLTDEESDELYRALHADYMRKWRLARAEAEALEREAMIARNEVELSHIGIEPNRDYNQKLLKRLRREAAL